MKTAAKFKRSVRRSEETVSGGGAMCAAVSVTKRSPKLLAADGTMRGVGVTKKRPRKADKPSNKEKMSEEKKKKRYKNKKREFEKQAAGDGFIDVKKEKRTMEEDAAGGMTKLSQGLLDYLRTKEVMGLLATEAPLLPWASKMGGALFECNQRLKEEIAAEFQENREFDAHVLYQYRTFGYAYAEIIKDYGYAYVYEEIIKETGTEDKSKKKKKKLVTHEINQAEMGYYLSNEVWSYVMSIAVHTFERAVIMEIEMSCHDPSTEARRRLDNRKRHIENQANLLRQYRTNGHAAFQYQVTDDERDVEEVFAC